MQQLRQSFNKSKLQNHSILEGSIVIHRNAILVENIGTNIQVLKTNEADLLSFKDYLESIAAQHFSLK